MDWKDASVDRMICKCGNVTKGGILKAIKEGARSLDDIRSATGACVRTHKLDPACMNCSANVAEMLEFYGGVVDAIRR